MGVELSSPTIYLTLYGIGSLHCFGHHQYSGVWYNQELAWQMQQLRRLNFNPDCMIKYNINSAKRNIS